MTKFEKQLRQWFPAGEFWGTPVYTGKTMLSRLDDNLLVKVSFIHTKIAQHYDALRVKIMNRTEGEIDSQVYLSVYIEFVFSKMQTTPRIGFWLDNSNQTPQQTAENILNARKPV